MVTRIHFEDEDEATRAAERLDAAGHEVAVIKERFAGEDDDEEVDWVLATTAGEPDVRAVLALDADAWVEADDPA